MPTLHVYVQAAAFLTVYLLGIWIFANISAREGGGLITGFTST